MTLWKFLPCQCQPGNFPATLWQSIIATLIEITFPQKSGCRRPMVSLTRLLEIMILVMLTH